MMKKLLLIIFTISFTFFLGADWNVGDLHKMGGAGPQLPDPTGYDVYNQKEIGDDWECGESGPVDEIHFWISFLGDTQGNKTLNDIGTITLQIWSDTPDPNPEDPVDFSHPNSILWEGSNLDYAWDVTLTSAFDGNQGWIDTWGDPVIPIPPSATDDVVPKNWSNFNV